ATLCGGPRNSAAPLALRPSHQAPPNGRFFGLTARHGCTRPKTPWLGALALRLRPAGTCRRDSSCHQTSAPTDPRRGNPPSVDPNSGFIGLQTHTGNVAFANVRIKTL